MRPHLRYLTLCGGEKLKYAPLDIDLGHNGAFFTELRVKGLRREMEVYDIFSSSSSSSSS